MALFDQDPYTTTWLVLDQRIEPGPNYEQTGEHAHVLYIACKDVDELRRLLAQEGCHVAAAGKVGFIPLLGTVHYAIAAYRCQDTPNN